MRVVNFHNRQGLVQGSSCLAWATTNVTYYGIICIPIHELLQFIRDISCGKDTAKELDDLWVFLEQNLLL